MLNIYTVFLFQAAFQVSIRKVASLNTVKSHNMNANKLISGLHCDWRLIWTIYSRAVRSAATRNLFVQHGWKPYSKRMSISLNYD